jgi:hypothetical protein
LLLPGNGTNNQNNHTFLDSSNNNFTITRNGNATQGTFSPFSQTGWSNLFDATGRYLSIPYSSSAFNLTGDFTVECWIYPTNLPSSTGSAAQSYARIWSFGTYNASNGLGLEIGSNDSGNLRRLISWYNGTQYGLSGNNIITPNQWYHIAVVRSGTTITCYVNGAATGTITGASAAVNRSQAFYIASLQGYESDSSAAFAGHISNFRVVNGTAVYTSNFTPSTSPLTAIANTTLLTCQSNRFIDVSNTAATITAANTPSIQAFSPIAPSASYAAANVGGSGYFDGTDDALILPSNSALALGSGDFTVEAWVYNQSGSNLYPDIFSNSGSIIAFIPNDRSSVYRSILSDDNYPSSGNATLLSASGTIGQNSWAHIAWVRSGSTITVYINGAASGTVTSSTNHTREMQIIGAIAQGASPNFYFWNGYISNLRIVKGTAVYTSNFTPPTALLTNIANTSLLANFTNAGITDATAKTVLETKGDAKISTAQSKFGGSSIVFDGTGDSLLVSNTSLTAFGTGDFTVEAWVYVVSGTSFGVVVGGSPGTPTWYLEYSSNRGLYFYDNASALNGNAALVTGAWKHLAVARYNNTLRTFVDGVLTSSHTSNSTMPQIALGVGAYNDNSYNLNGYIQGLRITKGIARYTIDFTPPTTAFLTK